MNVPLVLLNRRRRGSVGYNPAGLFARNEPGIWLDPSDLTTMFQDRAGTISVTTPGQSVGYRRDKSGRNNHAVANSDAARGIYGIEPLGGRRNLLTFTEQFDNAAWVKSNATVTANVDGVSDKLIPASAASDGRITQNNTGVSGSTYTLSVEGKAAEFSNIRLYSDDGGTNVVSVSYNLSTGAISTALATVGSWSSASTTKTDLPDGYLRLTMTWTATSSAPTRFSIWCRDTGNAASGILIRSAQLEASATATAYQRVVDEFNVTEAGKQTLHYVEYVSGDGFVTPTITPGTDKVQVFAGVRKLSDAAEAIIVEFSPVASNNGSFVLNSPFSGASSAARFLSRGTSSSQCIGSSLPSPISFVATGIGDIANDISILRVNGSQQAANTTDQGTGNFLAYPLYIGNRGGTTLFFRGRDYGIITRFGANLDASTIAATENWLNQKTGAF